MAGHAALAARFTRFLACPLVGRALLMRGLATLAGNLALLTAVHRSESAILFCHTDLLPSTPLPARSLRARYARSGLRASAFRAVGLQPRCHGSSGNLGNSQQ